MKYIGAGVASVIGMYLLYAFGNASFDITMWTEQARCICAILMAGCLFGCILYNLMGLGNE